MGKISGHDTPLAGPGKPSATLSGDSALPSVYLWAGPADNGLLCRQRHRLTRTGDEWGDTLALSHWVPWKSRRLQNPSGSLRGHL